VFATILAGQSIPEDDSDYGAGLRKTNYNSEPHGMVGGMATMKITITLDEEQVEQVRDIVAHGKASSVSGFVKHAVDMALYDAAGWKDMLETALKETGGPLTKKERAWADQLLTSRPHKSKRKKVA
jgi:Arc/MetJ-type ribon-helix-helix transcriptional regulator